MTTFIYKWKCRRCGLHAEAFSWQENWEVKFCPECGGEDAFLVFAAEDSDKEIFEFVPGDALPKMLTGGKA